MYVVWDETGQVSAPYILSELLQLLWVGRKTTREAGTWISCHKLPPVGFVLDSKALEWDDIYLRSSVCSGSG